MGSFPETHNDPSFLSELDVPTMRDKSVDTLP